MPADSHTTIAVAGVGVGSARAAGAQRFRAWLSESGIKEKLTLETFAGEIVAAS
jgi:hypothetical protein